jgi:hypothetical protein
MTPTLVFVHGRGQEGKDPAGLLTSWKGALASGLAAAGLPSLDDVPAVLPFYGDILARVTAQIEQQHLPVELESLHPALGSDVGVVERNLLRDMMAERDLDGLKAIAGASDPDQESLLDIAEHTLSWGAFRSVLISLAKLTKVDREIIKAILKDVAVYLVGQGARTAVLDVFGPAIPPAVPLVVVSHSLGTAVARDLLENDDYRSRTVAWVTLGSPLGLPAVYRNLLCKGPVHPAGVSWQTGYDVNDVVALGHPLRPIYHDPLIDAAVENGDAPHSIDRYLSHPEVARFIFQAVRS